MPSFRLNPWQTKRAFEALDIAGGGILEDELAGDRSDVRGWFFQSPGVVLQEGLDLVVHGSTPFVGLITGESLGDGGGLADDDGGGGAGGSAPPLRGAAAGAARVARVLSGVGVLGVLGGRLGSRYGRRRLGALLGIGCVGGDVDVALLVDLVLVEHDVAADGDPAIE
jgi:hypothetical protein